MACEHPMRAYARADGSGISFYKRKDPQYWVEPYTGLAIPCGHCILCRSEQARQQAIRIEHEARMWVESSFVTLTYTDKHLPKYGSLDYAATARFWKRIKMHFHRKQLGKLRYYMVGEYGDETLRPHYHACIFGQAFVQDRIIIRTKPTLLWTSPLLESIWGLGQVSVGALTFETARYAASYVTKKLAAKQQYVRTDEETGELIRLEQPRAFMSRNLAKDWWLKWKQGVIDHDYVVINGKRQKPPKAYDRWLREVDEKKAAEIKAQRMNHSNVLSYEEIRARARYAHARVKSKSKSI